MRRAVRNVLLSFAVLGLLGFSGCFGKDIIGVSNTAYEFGLNDTPWTFQIWNADPSEVAELSFTIRSDRSWLLCAPSTATSTGPEDKKLVTATVNRNGLAAGTYKGTIEISAKGNVVPKSIEVSVTSTGETETSGGWRLANIVESFLEPYLLEFDFSMYDENNDAIAGEPVQFAVTCREDGRAIGSETGAHLAKGTSKQFMSFLVLDYSLSMADIRMNGDANPPNGRSDALDAMESAAKNVFLDALSPEAQAGIYEFHRADCEPAKVADFSADKDYLKGRIDAIWGDYVRNFPAESRCWDALYAAALEFGGDSVGRRDELRAIVFISDGRDESSLHSYHEVINEAKARGVMLYAIGFGAELNEGALQILATQTNGQYFTAASIGDFGDRFQRILAHLDGQYVLRWATLKRTDDEFEPSFSISAAGHTLHYTATEFYAPTEYAGDPLRGVLRIIPADSNRNAVALVRAAYVPRYITRIALHVASPYDFTVEAVEAANGGLCDPSEWTLTAEDDGAGGQWLVLESENPNDIFTALPFAGFGPMLRFEFDALIDDFSTVFSRFEVDNSIYDNGQHFVVESAAR